MRYALMIALAILVSACSQASPLGPTADRSRTVQTADECGAPDMDPC